MPESPSPLASIYPFRCASFEETIPRTVQNRLQQKQLSQRRVISARFDRLIVATTDSDHFGDFFLAQRRCSSQRRHVLTEPDLVRSEWKLLRHRSIVRKCCFLEHDALHRVFDMALLCYADYPYVVLLRSDRSVLLSLKPWMSEKCVRNLCGNLPKSDVPKAGKYHSRP